MATFVTKVSIFYNYKDRGFSETLWTAGTQEFVAATYLKPYLTLRMDMADDDCQAVYARISSGANPRKVLPVSLINQGFVGQEKTAGSAPDDAIDIAFLSNEFDKGRIFIHAFPARFVHENVLTNFGAWKNKLEAWANYMTTTLSGWQVRGSNIDNVLGKVPILTAAGAKPRGFKFTVANLSNLAVGDVLLISASGYDAYGWNGRKVIQKIDTGTKTIWVGGADPVGTPDFDSFFFRRLLFAGKAIAKVIPIALTERKCGNPFGVPPGRQANTLPLRR